ncbi:hypothetical protein GCM10009743_07670 [Kribbella swartbergensis]
MLAQYDGKIALVREHYEPWGAAWNYITTATDPTLQIDDPDDSVTDAAWFTPQDAVRLLHQLAYPPITVPALAYLQTSSPTAWSFTLSDTTDWTWLSDSLDHGPAASGQVI